MEDEKRRRRQRLRVLMKLNGLFSVVVFRLLLLFRSFAAERIRSLESTPFGGNGRRAVVASSFSPIVGRSFRRAGAASVLDDAGEGGRNAGRRREEGVGQPVVEDVDPAADRERVVVDVDVVDGAAACHELLVDQHGSHTVLVDVDDDALVLQAGGRPAAAHQHAGVHRRAHLQCMAISRSVSQQE